MRIKVIAVGSTRAERAVGRWGVCFLLDDVLFDAFGKPETVFSNMRKMRLNPADIKYAVISHDHWDHITGLWHLISLNPELKVYICPGFSDEVKNRLYHCGVETVQVKGFRKIKGNLFATGEISRGRADDEVNEQALVYRSAKGVTIITGCAHPGIVRIIKRVKERFSRPVNLIIGGFHLNDTPDDRLRRIIEEIRSLGVERVAPAHCTGKAATRLLREAFKDKFVTIRERHSYPL